jgi:hypothetical protein
MAGLTSVAFGEGEVTKAWYGEKGWLPVHLNTHVGGRTETGIPGWYLTAVFAEKVGGVCKPYFSLADRCLLAC